MITPSIFCSLVLWLTVIILIDVCDWVCIVINGITTNDIGIIHWMQGSCWWFKKSWSGIKKMKKWGSRSVFLWITTETRAVALTDNFLLQGASWSVGLQVSVDSCLDYLGSMLRGLSLLQHEEWLSSLLLFGVLISFFFKEELVGHFPIMAIDDYISAWW